MIIEENDLSIICKTHFTDVHFDEERYKYIPLNGLNPYYNRAVQPEDGIDTTQQYIQGHYQIVNDGWDCCENRVILDDKNQVLGWYINGEFTNEWYNYNMNLHKTNSNGEKIFDSEMLSRYHKWAEYWPYKNKGGDPNFSSEWPKFYPYDVVQNRSDKNYFLRTKKISENSLLIRRKRNDEWIYFVMHIDTNYPSKEHQKLNNNLAKKNLRPWIYEVGKLYYWGKEKFIWYWITDYIEPSKNNSITHQDMLYIWFNYTTILESIHKNNYVISDFDMTNIIRGKISNKNCTDEQFYMVNTFVQWIQKSDNKANDLKNYMNNDNVKGRKENSFYYSLHTLKTREFTIDPIDNWMSMIFVIMAKIHKFVPECYMKQLDWKKYTFDIDIEDEDYVDYATINKHFEQHVWPTMMDSYCDKENARNDYLYEHIVFDKKSRDNERKDMISNGNKWKKNLITLLINIMFEIDQNITPAMIKENFGEICYLVATRCGMNVTNIWVILAVVLAYVASLNVMRTNYVDINFIKNYVATCMEEAWKDDSFRKLWSVMENFDTLPEDYDNLKEFIIKKNLRNRFDTFEEFKNYMVENDIQIYLTYDLCLNTDEWYNFSKNICCNEFKIGVLTENGFESVNVDENINNALSKVEENCDDDKYDAPNPSIYLKRLNDAAIRYINERTNGNFNSNVDPRCTGYENQRQINRDDNDIINRILDNVFRR